MVIGASDLLFWADEVRNLGDMDDPVEMAKCADIIARFMEWSAQQLLVADIREGA